MIKLILNFSNHLHLSTFSNTNFTFFIKKMSKREHYTYRGIFMKKILQLGSAFMGVIIGAGFASGQEILQYFTSFGILGTIGAVIATALFAYLGMALMRIGSRLKTTSHKDAIYKISGKYLGTIIDVIIILTLFGVGVVMIAGAGTNLQQQFGLPFYTGTIIMTLLVLLTAMLKIQRLIKVIGTITPFLILFIVIISIYSITTVDTPFAELNAIANDVPTTLPNWWISAINYVSFNIAVGASMALVMGGAERNEKTAALGGLAGGLGIGILILLSHLSIFTKIDRVAGFEMPVLEIVNELSPVLGIIFSIVLFGMIFNTAVSMFFAFCARFTEMGTRKFKIFLTVTMIVAFSISLLGFSNLVSYLYPLIGYLGLFLIFALIYVSIKLPSINKKSEDV